MKPTIGIIAVGSNIDPGTNVPLALQALEEAFDVLAVSPFFRTPAIDRPDQDDYWNGAVSVEPDGDPVIVRDEVLRPIEARLGRVRTEDAYAPRPIDLDIVLWGRTTLARDGMVLPDPDVMERPFLARAVAELDPDLVWPGQTIPVSLRLSNEAKALRPFVVTS